MSADSATLAAAIDRLAAATEADARERREAAQRARHENPEFRADLEALRRPLRKMPFGAFVSRIPELADTFEVVVPTNFWSLMEGRIDVACPCGATPHPGEWPAPCYGVEGKDCPRWYVYDGRDVRVAFSPKGGAPVPQDDDESSSA